MSLKGPKGKPLMPSTRKDGPWLRTLGPDNSLVARAGRGITGHAPTGEYCQRFNIPGQIECSCYHASVLSMEHILRLCPWYWREHWRQAPDDIEGYLEFLRRNPMAVSFPPREWDPG